MTKAVIYHSTEWEVLVETGWITQTVDDNGIAIMFKSNGSPRYPYSWTT